MRIGIAGPISLPMLAPLFPARTKLPDAFSFPLIASLALKLHERGHEIVVFALSDEVETTQVFAGDLIKVYVCPMRRVRYQMLDLCRGERRALADAMRQAGCDVIHAHWTYEFAAAAIESGVRNVITAHDSPLATLRYAQHPLWLLKPFLAWGVLKNAQRLTAVSPYTVACLRRVRARTDIVTVGNGVVPEVFALHEKWLHRKINDKMVFASISNGWGGRKNGTKLAQAFAQLRRRFGDKVELWLIGHGHEEGGPAERWIKKRSLEAGIRFFGALPYLQTLNMIAEGADILVHPSLEETWGMVVTEAMAIGLPVIGGSHSGAIPWLLADGNAGLLVDVKSSSSIYDGMQAMADNSVLRSKLALAGHTLARSHYQIEASVGQYEEILLQASQEQRQ